MMIQVSLSDTAIEPTIENDKSLKSQHDHRHAKLNLIVAIVGGIFILNSALAKWFFFRDQPFASVLSAVLGSLLLMLPIFISAIKDLKQGKFYMNELVALALLAAFVMGNYQEAGIIAFFMLIAITIEEKTAFGAQASIEQLIRLTPATSRRLNPETDEEEEVLVKQLRVDERVRVRPGENFPADGIIIKGTSTVNQASITGESLPVDKKDGSEIYAGTENLTGSVDVRVTGVGRDTTLGKVRDLIEAAEKTRLPILRMADRYVLYYTPTIIMVAALVWFFTQDLMRVVLVLVMSCPCALVVATPSAVVAAIAAAARLGILIKNVAHIESAAKIDAVVFDKTGTLTEGRLEVCTLKPAANVELTELLSVAASAESQSNHPAARATCALAKEASVSCRKPNEFTELAGKGVVAGFDDGEYRVGRQSWLRENGLDVEPIDEPPDNGQSSSEMSIVWVAKDEKVLGWIGFRDAVRASAKESVAELRKLGISQCYIMTGDNEAVAKLVGERVGISEIEAACLPETKVRFIENLKSTGSWVAVIGDGVNDAPALAAGDIGIALGAIGSDIAVNSASVALMNDDLRRVPFFIELSRKTRMVINTNLVFGVVVIIGGLMFFIFGNEILDALAAQLKFSPSVFKALIAATAHIMSTLAVFFNSARLVRFGEDATQ
jgi:Zn2+/Cd2+-exporting ATPase